MDLGPHHAWFNKRLLERFLRYVKIDTSSDRRTKTQPSSPGQRVLAEVIAKELTTFGCENVSADERSYLFARLPARSRSARAPILALIAHLDTSPDAPGQNVRPRLHHRYDGRPIVLAGGLRLDPKENPDLLRFRGGTVITSSGDTLLGADDKAGLAAIVTAVEFLSHTPSLRHGALEIVFTPDEETGRGTDHFPWQKVSARAAVTVDGSGDGIVEAECFFAYRAVVTVTGKSFHPGEARGRLVNAVEIAAAFISRLPANESPQAADGRYGFYLPLEVKGNIESAAVECLIRDFDEAECRRRIAALRSLAAALKRLYPGASLSVKTARQYANMKPWIERARPDILAALKEAVRRTGIEPEEKSIRGGTDGARLSEKGLPCPNLFCGGYNYHARTEWAALPAMVRSAQALVHLAELWGSVKTSTFSR